MQRRAIILCGGEGERWNNYLGVQKHLVPIDGKPLLHRTVDLLRNVGLDDILIAGRGEEYLIPQTEFLHVPEDNCNEPAEKFKSSRAHWLEDGTTTLLFGDVFFSAHAIKAAVEPQSNAINFLGRLTPSRITGCPYREIFALAFDTSAHDAIDRALVEIAGLGNNQPTGWQLYRILGDQAALGRLEGDLQLTFTHVDDLTEDFDSPEDHAKWLTHRAAGQVIDVHNRDAVRLKATRRKWQIRAQLAFAVGVAVGALLLILFLAMT